MFKAESERNPSGTPGVPVLIVQVQIKGRKRVQGSRGEVWGAAGCCAEPRGALGFWRSSGGSSEHSPELFCLQDREVRVPLSGPSCGVLTPSSPACMPGVWGLPNPYLPGPPSWRPPLHLPAAPLA